MQRCVFRIALAGHLMLLAPGATAQDYRGRVQGTVLDSTRSALPGTTIGTGREVQIGLRFIF